ncbi:MAG: hypothetical protein ACD_47C00165G0001 [uncultured bacterium]|nr:MAG: hypothetical protein ACD_47C00165G0001 [uncultured bacterium]
MLLFERAVWILATDNSSPPLKGGSHTAEAVILVLSMTILTSQSRMSLKFPGIEAGVQILMGVP